MDGHGIIVTIIKRHWIEQKKLEKRFMKTQFMKM